MDCISEGSGDDSDSSDSSNSSTSNSSSDSVETQLTSPLNGLSIVTSSQTPSHAPRVVVVGAGISGLRAASVLKRHGVDVVVLEARHDRVGGRMYTRRVDGKPPREIGAAWMHETAQNKLVHLVPELNLKYYYDDGVPLYYTPFGPGSTQFKAKKVCDEFADYCEWFYETHPTAPDRSAQEFIKEYVENHPLLTKDERTWAPEALREVELWIALNTDLASARHLSYYITERNLYVTGGYDTVVNYYAQPLIEDKKIIMGCEVSKIRNESDRVQIDASQSNIPITFAADAAIVTTPLGVLKHDMISFEPKLPQAYYEALNHYSYAALGKLFFEFEEVFWPKERDQIIFYPFPKEKQDKDHPVLNNAFVINNLYVVAGIKELCIQTSDPLTRNLEQMTKDEIYNFFEPLFKAIRTEPYKDLPKMIEVEITQWTKDKYAGFGTYSAIRVGDDPHKFMDFLESNRDSRVQFAGEHCSVRGNGCVHGAYYSGEVAAKNLLDKFGLRYDGDDSPISSPLALK